MQWTIHRNFGLKNDVNKNQGHLVSCQVAHERVASYKQSHQKPPKTISHAFTCFLKLTCKDWNCLLNDANNCLLINRRKHIQPRKFPAMLLSQTQIFSQDLTFFSKDKVRGIVITYPDQTPKTTITRPLQLSTTSIPKPVGNWSHVEKGYKKHLHLAKREAKL